MNLFHCLNELNDNSLLDEIQKALNSGHLSYRNMSPAQWPAVAFLLLSLNSDLEEFDLKNYYPSEDALEGLLPVIKASRKALLSYCNLTFLSCKLLSSVLSCYRLRHLDLSNNDLQDSGVELLCSGLKSAPSRLETLSLSCCNLSQSSCGPLSSVLRSSNLTHLDLSNNNLQDTGIKLLYSELKNAPCRLEILSLDPAGEKWKIPGARKYFCELSLDLNTVNRKLRLSDNNRTVTYVNEDQPYPDHQDRFDSCPQALSSAPLTDRCYWEVEWKLRHCGFVHIAVSHIGIASKGDSKVCEFGKNQHSWALRVSREGYSVWHGGKVFRESRFTRSFTSGRVAVYVNYTAGSLSFYHLSSDKLILLHTFHSTFDQPLCAGFGLWGGSVSLVGRAPGYGNASFLSTSTIL